MSEDKKDNTDDIFGDDFLTEASDKNPDKTESTKAEEPSVDLKTEEDSAKLEDTISKERMEEVIPSLRGEGYPSDYTSMVERVKWQYEMLPNLKYDSIYKEMAELSVKACPTPTLQVLNDEIQKVQGAKDRLSEIFIDIVKCYNFKKRAVDILEDAWGKFTSEKNADGRKGDAAFRLSNFIMDFASTEALLKACTHVFKNLDSLHDSLSRRITIYQLTMKLHDVGRTALPDYDFDSPSSNPNEDISEIFGEHNKEESGDGGKPELRSF